MPRSRKCFLWLVVLVSSLSVIGWFAVVHTPDRRICSVAEWSCRTIRLMGTQLSNYPVTSVANVSLLQTTSSGQLNGSNLSVSPHSNVVNETVESDTPYTQPRRTLGSLALDKTATESNSSQLHQFKTAVELRSASNNLNTITDSQLSSVNAVTDPVSGSLQDIITDDSKSPSSLLTETSKSSTQSLPSTQMSGLQFILLPKESANTINHGTGSFQSKSQFGNKQTQSSRPFSFEIHDPFHLPQPVATKSAEELLQTEWMRELKEFLKGVQSPDPIALVTSDYNYRGVLLNWIVKATIALDPPIDNIMVLSLDLHLYELLKSREISCVYVEPSSFLKPTTKFKGHIAFSESMIIRLTVMRFINHWGFDVVNYDSDALVMRNPGPIFEQHKEADIIGSYGNFPQGIRDKWGVVLCMGVIMIRSSPQSELFWETFTNSAPETFNDQAKLNIALYTLGLKFKNHSVQDRWSIETETWEAEGRDGLSVIVLPAAVVCRQTCKMSRNKQVHYYIWHRGGKSYQESKARYAAQAGLWRLRENWEQITNNTTATGDVWMKAISTY